MDLTEWVNVVVQGINLLVDLLELLFLLRR